MEKVIILDHVSAKDLKDVSVTIQSGEVVGIVGDGAFSNPLLRVISGLNKISSGFVSIMGFDPFLKNKDFLKQISYIKEKSKNQLETYRSIYRLSSKEFNKNLFELSRYIKDRDIIAHLIHLPKLLIFDEVNFNYDFIYEYNKNTKSTILVSTNKIDKLIGLVRRLIVVNNEKIVFDGAIDEFIEKYAKDKYIRAKLLSEADVNQIGEISTLVSYQYPYVCLSSPRSVVHLTAAEFMQNFPVESISIEEMPIEEIVKNI